LDEYGVLLPAGRAKFGSEFRHECLDSRDHYLRLPDFRTLRIVAHNARALMEEWGAGFGLRPILPTASRPKGQSAFGNKSAPWRSSGGQLSVQGRGPENPGRKTGDPDGAAEGTFAEPLARLFRNPAEAAFPGQGGGRPPAAKLKGFRKSPISSTARMDRALFGFLVLLQVLGAGMSAFCC